MGANETLGVLLVDDDSMVRGWVRLSLKDTEFRMAGEASSAAEAIELVRRRVPDVLLVDYNLAAGSVGTELVRDLRRAGFDMPAVVMTAQMQRGFNETAREAGAQATLLKTGKREELLRTLRLVVEGDGAYDHRHPRRDPGRGALSPREREALQLVAGGSTNREIAKALDVGDETVKTLLARTFAKLGVKRRAEAVSEAHKRGLI
jgi:DNA-binding NarL/FixJ family response regulator